MNDAVISVLFKRFVKPFYGDWFC